MGDGEAQDVITAPEKKQETRDEMLSRHRMEIAELQSKETELKKAAARGSKAEQKAKKKKVNEEMAQLSSDLKEKHAEQLSSLGYASTGNDKAKFDNLVKAVAGVSVTNQADHAVMSKSTRWRNKRAQQEADREQRIQEEQNSVVSDKIMEDEKLKERLAPLGMTIKEMKPDGHCLYRAVEDQLAIFHGGSSPYSYQDLRKMVAVHMRQNLTKFQPFFVPNKDTATDFSNSPSSSSSSSSSSSFLRESFLSYCEDVECTAMWGDQMQLKALTHCLKMPIIVYLGLAAEPVEMGSEFRSDGGDYFSDKCIRLSFHKHAFALGEHYNSVVLISDG